VKRKDATSLGEALKGVAGRLKKVNLDSFGPIRERWNEVADPVVRDKCEPAFVKDGVLVVYVPSGAYAERLRQDEAILLRDMATLGAQAPTGIRAIVR
jgi:predicted nucleic acid-binding Zn ribbon protein